MGLGPDHPGTLNSRGNLAAAYRVGDRVAEAIPLLEQTLADHGVKLAHEISQVRRWSMACVAWPTCGLSITEAERALLALGSGVAVVRLTKVLAAELPLIGRWVEALKAGKPVEAFTDLICAPMPVDFVAEALARIGAQQKGGLFHLSGGTKGNGQGAFAGHQ